MQENENVTWQRRAQHNFLNRVKITESTLFNEPPRRRMMLPNQGNSRGTHTSTRHQQTTHFALCTRRMQYSFRCYDDVHNSCLFGFLPSFVSSSLYFFEQVGHHNAFLPVDPDIEHAVEKK